MRMYFRSGYFKSIYLNLILYQYISMYHEFNTSYGSLLRLVWCKLKWQISLEYKATVLPHPPNPQKRLQPGSQWVLTLPAGPSSNSELLLTSVRSGTQQPKLCSREELGKTEHKTASDTQCLQFHLPPSTHRPLSRWALAELTAEPSDYIPNRNLSSFHAGNNLLLTCE